VGSAHSALLQSISRVLGSDRVLGSETSELQKSALNNTSVRRRARCAYFVP